MTLALVAAKALSMPSMPAAIMSGGAAQYLLKRGLDTAGILRAGGWKSVNVLARYLEQADHNPWL